MTNPFEIATKDSKTKMNLIARDHDSRLEAGIADPEILALYTPFNIEKEIYQTLMSQWISVKGVSKSRTRSWTDELDVVSKDLLYVWEGKIFAVYPSNSTEALAIFPNGRAPLTTAKYEVRLLAFTAFHITLGTYPLLATLTTEVGDKLDEIKLLRKVQTEYFGRINLASSKVEVQRKVLSRMCNNDLSTLKIKFCDDIDQVKIYFDLSLLRRIVNDNDAIFHFNGAVEAGMTYTVVLPEKLTVSANASCTFANQSDQVDMQFFFSANGSAADSAVKTTVLPNESATGTAAESGWAPGANFLIVKNTGAVTAEFEGMVVEAMVEG